LLCIDYIFLSNHFIVSIGVFLGSLKFKNSNTSYKTHHCIFNTELDKNNAFCMIKVKKRYFYDIHP
ncbi:MAG: hypothetical protein IJ881_01835, partial [Neisseriaceae bacterium]|nr:hypothetical protein [Neisseriaceae bacterium]